MKNFKIILTITLLIFGVSVFGQTLSSNKLTEKKPNILFIVVDDLKPTIGAYQDSIAKTPCLDKLATESIVFENTYCQQAVCAPSRISFFTGKRPDRTKIYDLKTKMREKNPDIVTAPQFFKSNGYETVGFGKLMHGAKNNDPQSWSIPYKNYKKLKYAQGYDIPARGDFQNPEIHAAVKYTEVQNMNWKQTVNYLKEQDLYPSTEVMDTPDDAYLDGAIAEAGIKMMKRLTKSEKPFFLALGFQKPHLPFAVPKKYWDLYDREDIEISPFQSEAENSPGYAYHPWGELRGYTDIPDEGPLPEDLQKQTIHGYLAATSYVDAQIAKVLDALKALGQEENTIVVLWGDHGWHLGDHGLWCKHSNFEQATKVPLFIKAPGYKKGQIASAMVELVDIFPTLVEFAGLELPKDIEGESLIPVLEDVDVQIKDYAISQYPRGKNVMGYSIRTKRYRLTLWLKGDYMNEDVFRNPDIDGMELYDYEIDPLEKVSQANNPEYTETRDALKTKLLDLLIEQADEYGTSEK